MRRRLVLLFFVLLAAPAHADRLDPIVAALQEHPVAVDQDLVWMLSPADERRLTRAADDAGVPVFIAFVPSLREDDTGGDRRRVAYALADRVARDGLYVVVDQDGYLDTVARQIPRELQYDFEEERPTGYRTLADLKIVPRLESMLRRVGDAPAGETDTTGDRQYLSPIDPLHYPPERPPPVIADLALAGGLGLLGGACLGLPLRHWRRRRA